MKKFFKIFLVFILILWGIIVLADTLTIQKTKNAIYSDISQIPENKVGLLLWTSKYITDGRINLFYTYRLEAAKSLYDARKIDFILVSGDNGDVRYNETDTMKQDLIEIWIPEEKIYGDYAGFRTLDSVVRARDIFGQESYTIITQKFHLERAIFLAQSEEIEAIWFPAKDVPVSRAPRVWIRERLARVKMMLDIIFGVNPKFGGESIEIM